MAKKKKRELESEDLKQEQTDYTEDLKQNQQDPTDYTNEAKSKFRAEKKNKKTDDGDELKDTEEMVVETKTVEANTEVEESNLEDDYAELNDRFLRLVAEYDNFRKRSQKEKDSLYNDSVFDVCKAWLPVLDNLDRAIDAATKSISEESKQMAEGMEMVRRQATEVMSGLGVDMMDCLGEKFDPEYHEAVAHIEDDSYGDGEIIDVLQKGYIKGDRVIRHAVVRVAN
ncbi:MAG: nucleotide exchange factor GrpE [Clostridiaceae bacterium]|nr:nucleotide exchange factor GrpE [Clostridiaceae bacterium]